MLRSVQSSTKPLSSYPDEEQLKFLTKYASKIDSTKYRNGKKYYIQYLEQTTTPEKYGAYIRELLQLNYIHRTLKVSSIKYFRDIRMLLIPRTTGKVAQEAKMGKFKTVDEVAKDLDEIIEANSRRSSQQVEAQEDQEIIQIVQMDSDVSNSKLQTNPIEIIGNKIDRNIRNSKIQKDSIKLGVKQPKTADIYKTFQTSFAEDQKNQQDQQEVLSSVRYEIHSSGFKYLKIKPKECVQVPIKCPSIKSERTHSVCIESDQAEKPVTAISARSYGKSTQLIKDLQKNNLYHKHHHNHQDRTNSPERGTTHLPKISMTHKKMSTNRRPNKQKRIRVSLNICNKIIQFLKSIFLSNDRHKKGNRQEENARLIKSKQQTRI